MLGVMRRLSVSAAAAAALVVAASFAYGGVSKPLPGLPAYAAAYKSWTKLNRKPIPPRANDPHYSVKNVYASKKKSGARYPYGTVIVKEGLQPGKGWVRLMAVMRKVRGASPRNNDWQMREWVRSSPTARFTEIASGAVCYSCHVGAKRNDYVFTKR
jgi:Cytochrome P460